jgi:hypothetical protein
MFTMAKGTVAKDPFGNPVREHPPRYEAALERGEKETLPERAARSRAVSRHPQGPHVRDVETGLVFDEANIFA